MGFSRQEHWSGMLCPPPGDLPGPGIKPASLTRLLHWQASSLPMNHLGSPFIAAQLSSAQSLSCVQLFATPWTVACQAPLSMGFSRHEYWSGLPCPPPGDLPGPGIKPTPPVSPVLAGRFFTTEPPGKPPVILDRGKTTSEGKCLFHCIISEVPDFIMVYY